MNQIINKCVEQYKNPASAIPVDEQKDDNANGLITIQTLALSTETTNQPQVIRKRHLRTKDVSGFKRLRYLITFMKLYERKTSA